jgi:membrane-associated phospholipid phosphatase
MCILLIDRPVERFVFTLRPLRPVFQLCAAPSLLPLPLSFGYLGLLAYGKLQGQRIRPGLFLTMSAATLAATALKDELKWMFGRPWPQYWEQYGLYSFHPFANDWLYGSFPSGHTSYIAAPMLVLMALRPRYAALSAGVLLLVMFGLVGAGYHYVGDVVAGFFVGLASAAGAIVLLQPHQGNAAPL